MRLSKGNLSNSHKLALGLFFALPLLIIIGKWSLLPTCGLFERLFSLADMPHKMNHRIAYILFVPFGATVVVFFRLVLGIRLMGPFRSILIAIAFQITGILPGLFFLAMVIGVVVLIRPPTKAIKLPYFARVSVILSAVASIMILALLSGAWLEIESLCRMAYFPIIALCLMGEGFAKTLSKEGLQSAVWRAAATVFVAALITFFSQIDGFRSMFLYYPELLLCQIGCIVIIAEFFDLRLLSFLNPPNGKRRSNRNTHDIGLVPA